MSYCEPQNLNDLLNGTVPTPAAPQKPVLSGPEPMPLGDRLLDDVRIPGSLAFQRRLETRTDAQAGFYKDSAGLRRYGLLDSDGNPLDESAMPDAPVPSESEGGWDWHGKLVEWEAGVRNWSASAQVAVSQFQAETVRDVRAGIAMANAQGSSLIALRNAVAQAKNLGPQGNDLYNNANLSLDTKIASTTELINNLGAIESAILGTATDIFKLDPKTFETWKLWREESLDPLLNGIKQSDQLLNTLRGFQSPEGWLTNAAPAALAQLETAFGDTALMKNAHTVLATLQNLQSSLREIDNVLRAADEMLAAAQSLFLSVCQLLPAATMLVKNLLFTLVSAPFLILLRLIQDLIAFANMLMTVGKLPTFGELKSWSGLWQRLNGMGATWSQCKTALLNFENPNMAALDQGLAALSTMGAKLDAGTFAVGKLVSIPSANPILAAWEITPSMVKNAPPRANVGPEDAALLGPNAANSQGAAPSGVNPDDTPPGRSALDHSDLRGYAVDPDTNALVPVVTPPLKSFMNQTQLVKELTGLVRTGAAVGDAIGVCAINMKRLHAQCTEEDAKDALVNMLGASAAMAALSNLSMDSALDPGSLSPAARDFYACKLEKAATTAGHGWEGPADDDLVAAAKNADKGPAGHANSVMSRALGFNPAAPGAVPPKPEAVIATLPLGGMPPGWYAVERQPAITAFRDPNLGKSDVELRDMPFALACATNSTWTAFGKLRSLSEQLADIEADPERLATHQGLHMKALQQGYLAASPYTWLASAFETLEDQTLLERLSDFLAHRPGSYKPMFQWLDSLATLDDKVPLPLGLTDAELAAANESLAWPQAGKVSLSGPVYTMRLAADELGGPLGFEYLAAVSALTLMARLQALLALPETTPAEATALAAHALAHARALTHGDELAAALEALVDEET